MKFTVKQPIPKDSFIPTKVRAYWNLSRPFTLLLPAIVSVCVMATCLEVYGKVGAFLPNMGIILFVALSLALLNASSNALNQVCDLKADKINKPYRPIPSGYLTKREALLFAMFGYAIVVSGALVFKLTFGILIALIAVISICYSIPPFRLKNRIWISNFSIATARGYLGILASWSVFGNLNVILPHVLGMAMFIYLVGSMSFKDLSDVKGDLLAGAKTLPMVYGARNTTLISVSIMFMSHGFLFTNIIIGTLIFNFVFVCIVSTFMICVMMYLCFKGRENKTGKLLENNWLWGLMYIDMMIIAIGYVVCYY